LKKFIFFTLLLASLVGCGSPAPAAVLVYSSNGTYVVKTTLAAAAVAADAGGKRVVFTSNQTLTANLNWPTDRELAPENGAKINHGAYTVTYAGSRARWPMSRIFNGTGAVTLSGVGKSHSIWFAVPNDSGDDTLSLRCWIGSSTDLWLDDGSYVITRQASEGVILGLRSNLTLEGNKSASINFPDGAADATNFWRMIGISHSTGGLQNFENITLRGFTINGGTLLTDYDVAHEQNHGIFFYTNQGGYIRNILIEDINGYRYSGDVISTSTGTKDVVVRRCRATDWLRQGVNLAGTGNMTAYNNYAHPMTTSTYSGSGIHCEPSAGVDGFYVYNNDVNAILVSGDTALEPLKNGHVYKNTVTGKIGGSWYNSVEIEGNTCGWIEITRAINPKIHHNTVKVTTNVNGIYVAAVSGTGANAAVDSNTVTTSYATPTGYGIYLNQNAGQWIRDNQSVGFKYGIGIQGGSNNVVTGNYASGTTYGALLASSAATPTSGISVIARNVLTGTTADLRISDSTWANLHLDKNKLVNGTLSLSGNPTFKFDDYLSISADKGNASATLTVGSSPSTNVWATVLTADRAVTLSADAQTGAKFKIVRTAAATGAFNLNVGTGPLKALAAGQWCEVEYNGSAWILAAFGSL
jgi:hypothetical protein